MSNKKNHFFSSFEVPPPLTFWRIVLDPQLGYLLRDASQFFSVQLLTIALVIGYSVLVAVWVSETLELIIYYIHHAKDVMRRPLPFLPVSFIHSKQNHPHRLMYISVFYQRIKLRILEPRM
jgi:hypothetical protein